ncbi:BED-type domain-containing protein [Trichonephila clavipes]|nr:BED-type domain-containing protein [Trichonephila clavipes]
MMIRYYDHYFKQYIKGKPIRFRYKMWALCGNNGYCYNFDLFCGKEVFDAASTVVLSKEPLVTRVRRNKTNFENFDRRKRADRRGKPHWPELEAEINKWILKERDDGKAVSTRGWSTSGLLRHLQIQHNISKATQSVSSGSQNTEITKRKIDSDNDIRITPERKKPLLSYFLKEKKETLEEIVSKLVCVDGFTVNAITKSNSIRKSLHDKDYSFPPNPSDVMKLVYKQYNVIKARVTNEISSKLNAGLRCSLTFDEFTSLKNRRYLNINVHFNEGEIFNLGMLRISGSFSAENCVKVVETKLQEFEIITEKHIVACVTDGASMMVKFGKIMSCEYHLCYAHAIHLAVCDVLYNKQIDLVENTVEVEDKSHEEDNGESEELVEDLDKALDLEFESGVGTDALFHVTYAEKNSITNINETIKKIKNVVKLSRKSPIKNILQKYVKEEFGCERLVCLDTKTRWSSLLAMLEIFLEINSAISKALIDIKDEQMMVNVEFETVITIVKGLKPVKIGLEKLCSRNATLLTAEGVFSFVIGELNEQNSEFAKNMKYSLIQRINERRNVNLIGLMQYLNFGRKYEAAAVTGDIS